MMELLVLAVVGGGGLLGLALVLFLVLGKSKKLDPDSGLRENLAEYPPARKAGTHRLQFEGQPVRLRLIVLAPSGRATELKADMAEGLLQAVHHGMGEVADLDRPRVKVWPGQLSMEGFAPKFFDNIDRPEQSGKPSRWILVAGPAKAGQKTILLGLALETTEPTTRGNVRLSIENWSDKFRVQVTG